MLIVNYYPGSAGDTVIAKLSNLPYRKDSLNRTHIKYPRHLKQTRFYKMPSYLQDAMYKKCVAPWLTQNKIIGAHRFNAYDFSNLDNQIQTLSIDPRQALYYVAEMYLAKVYDSFGHGNIIIDSTFKKITDRYGNNHTMLTRAIVKQIGDWADENIKASDITLCLAKILIKPNCLDEYKTFV